MYKSRWFEEERPQGGAGAFITLSLTLLAGGAFLYVTAGPPQLPSEIPSWDRVMRTLAGSDLPPEIVSYLLTTLAWAIWFWIVGSIALRLVALAGEARARGSAWARRLRAFSDRVTLPVVRRVVDAALFTVVMLNVASRSAPTVAAAPLPTVVEVREVGGRMALTADAGDTSDSVQADDGTSRYTVRAGDTLWTISERFYGTGLEYMRLVDANTGREMPDGRRFTRTGVIQPGWILTVPPTSRAVDQIDGQSLYTVQKCDTLAGIASRLLGDETRWPEIFELNRESAKMPDGRVLANPNLIWPGLQLRLPGAVAEASKPAPEEIAEAEAPPEAAAPVDEIPAADETAPAPLPVDEPPGSTAPEDELRAPTPQIERRPTVVVEAPRPSGPGLPPELIYGAAATAVSAAVGGGIYVARRRFRRSLSEPPVSRAELGYEDEQGFAEGDVARVFVHRVHGAEVEPVARIAGAMLDLLAAEGIRDVSLVSAHQGRGSIGLTLEAGLADQERIVELAPTIAARLGGGCEARSTPDRDVLVRLTTARPADLLAPPTALQGELPLLLPIGLVQRREPLYASWSEMKNVLVAGATGVGTDAVLTSLVASLVARRHPRDLQLWTIAERGSVAPQILELPHQRRVCTDSQDTEAVSNTLAEIRQELERRIAGGGDDREMVVSELVLVIGELASLPDDSAALDVILRDGPAYGIRVLAGTTRPEALAHDLTAEFGMSLVLHLDEEEHSVQLLGRPDAADLGADGDVLFRVGGRSPVLLRGFRVAPERLDQLVDLMANEYAGSGSGRGGSDSSPSGGSPPSPADYEVPGPGTPGALPSPGEEQSVGGLFNEETPTPGSNPGTEPKKRGDSTDAGDGEGSAQAPTTDEAAEASETAGDQGSSPSVSVKTEEPPGLLATLEQRRMQSMVQVRCFGGLQVTNGERELKPESKDGPRYKPWEILACLAAYPARGVPKEKLLNALWPGVGPERATSRLYSNLNSLRTVLSEQVPGLSADAARGDRSEGMYRLDANLVWSDVHEFLALSEGARKLPPPERKLAYEQARALYVGSLLKDTPYKWVNAEDEHGYTLWESYREKYRQLTCHLAQLYSAEGEPDRAVVLYRDLLQDEPTLEDVVRQLFRCYQQLGDRGSLIRDERLLREAIRQRYGDPDDPDRDPSFYEPEPETTRVYQEVLAGFDAGTISGRR